MTKKRFVISHGHGDYYPNVTEPANNQLPNDLRLAGDLDHVTPPPSWHGNPDPYWAGQTRRHNPARRMPTSTELLLDNLCPVVEPTSWHGNNRWTVQQQLHEARDHWAEQRRLHLQRNPPPPSRLARYAATALHLLESALESILRLGFKLARWWKKRRARPTATPAATPTARRGGIFIGINRWMKRHRILAMVMALRMG